MASNDDLYTALQALTRQIQQQNDFVRQTNERVASRPPNALGTPSPSHMYTGSPVAAPITGSQQASAPSLPPSGKPVPNLREISTTDTWQDFTTRRRALINDPDFNGNATAQALAEYAPTPAPPSNIRQGGGPGTLPPNGIVAGGLTTPPGVGHTALAQAQAFNSMGVEGAGGGVGHGGFSQNDVLTLAMLGEHGAPAMVRNVAMRSYGIQQSLTWAQRAAQAVQGTSWVPTGIQNAMAPMQGALNMAINNPLATYLGAEGLRTITGTIGSINAHAANAQALGQSFGYGPGGHGANAFFGFRNPLNDFGSAAGVGFAFDVERQALMGRIPDKGFGAGLTNEQATSALDTIGNLGFSENPLDPHHPLTATGNASTIANSLFRPLMSQMPGLNAQEIGQFTTSLRNAGTSVDVVRNQLSQLGNEAQATSTNINTMASEIKDASNSIAGMGSSTQGSTNLVQGFTNITGLSGAPDMAANLAKNSMVQGMTLGQYGILPSGIGDMNPGAFASSAQQTAQLLNRALSGIDRNVYRNVNGVNVLVQSGEQARTDQIAQMLGIPSNQVKAWLGQQGRSQARSNLQSVIGSQGAQGTGGTGLWQLAEDNYGHPNAHQMSQFNREWQTGVVQHLKGTGISQSQIDKLSKISDPRKRLQAMDQLLASTASNNGQNNVQKREDPQTVKVEFTGAAARYFQTLNGQPTIAKNKANAGGASYNAIINSPGGDPQKNLSNLLTSGKYKGRW